MTSDHEKILVVDNDKAIREQLRQKLTKEGYACQEASNADEALERIKANPPALAVLDVKIAGKRGAKLWREIRALYPDTMAIVATGDDDASIAVECMKRGIDDYLTKPLSLDEVVRRVHKALTKRKPELRKTGPQQLEFGTEDLKTPATKTTTSGIKQLDGLLKLMVDKVASDLHLRVSAPPVLRIDGMLIPQYDMSPITAEEMDTLFLSITTPEQRDTFAQEMELDFVHSVPHLARFRVNALRQQETVSLALRLMHFDILSIDDLELPPILKELVLKPRGLILVTGPTGSGKSTTLAAMINHLNENVVRNIITIEDPVELIHHNKRSIIAQRDLYTDAKSFATALVRCLRHDPDVVVVGEMRDLETMATAITAAEMGRLVLSTLHTVNAAQTIDRVIDVFPPAQQQQIRFQLSQVLEAVLSQVLLRRIGGGRVAAFEIMVATPAVRNLIREGKTFQLPSVLQLGGKDGMQTLTQSLADLVKKKVIIQEEAMSKTSDPDQLRKLLSSQQ